MSAICGVCGQEAEVVGLHFPLHGEPITGCEHCKPDFFGHWAATPDTHALRARAEAAERERDEAVRQRDALAKALRDIHGEAEWLASGRHSQGATATAERITALVEGALKALEP